MTRPFSIPTVLRMVPPDLMKSFLTTLGHDAFDLPCDRLARKEELVRTFLAYLDELPRAQVDELEAHLHGISDLASDGGFEALTEAAAVGGIPDLGAQVPSDLCVWGRSMWIWLHHRAIFDKAQILHQIEHMAWWRKRNDLPKGPREPAPDALERLTRGISALLKAQGRGKDCTVERLERGALTYYFAYPDDFVQHVTVHDHDRRLTVEAFRQTLLIVFAYDQAEGSLELYARGLHKPIKEQLERLFADAVLREELRAFAPDAAYELDQLKDPHFDLQLDPGDRIDVRIRRLRLSSACTGRRLVVEVDDDPQDDIRRAIDECVNLDDLPLSQWHVTQATFCFEFLPADGRKPGRQSFDVGYPRSCSLRSARPERVEVIRKYLKRWKIDRAESAESAVLPLGY